MARIPEEVLAQIFEQLVVTHQATQTLYDVSLASKSFNRIAEPLLYRTFDLSADAEGIRIRRSDAFLKALSLRPSRGTHVREFKMAPGQMPFPPEPGTHEADGHTCREPSTYLREAVDAHPLVESLKTDILCETMHGSQDTFAALLIWMCPNLERWDIEAGERSLTQSRLMWSIRNCVSRLSWAAKQSPPLSAPLQQLKHIRVEGKDTRMYHCAPLFKLPSARTFESRSIDHITSTHKFTIYSAPHITSLDLSGPPLNGEIISHLLTRFSSLKSLSLAWTDSIILDFHPGRFGDMGAEFRKRGAHLTNLRLLLHIARIPSFHFGSLAGMTALRTLEISLPLLAGGLDRPPGERNARLVDILPTALEELTLDDCRIEVLDALQDRLEELWPNPRFANLRVIRLRSVAPIDRVMKARPWSWRIGVESSLRREACAIDDCCCDGSRPEDGEFEVVTYVLRRE